MTKARDTNPVRLRREALGMLLTELAAKCEMSAGKISMIEGGFVPKLPTMLVIAQALQTTPVTLWPAEVEEISPDA